MALTPLAMGAFIGSAIVGGLTRYYETYQNNQVNQYTNAYSRGAFVENGRFWTDYRKNTGKTPVYPYRAGSNYNLTTFYSTQAGLNNYGARQIRNVNSIVPHVGYTFNRGGFGLKKRR